MSSRAALGATLAACLVALLWSYQTIEQRSHDRADAQSRAAAEMITGLLLDRHLVTGEVATGSLGEDAVRRLRQDVAALRSAGDVVALRVWRLDGVVMFLDVDRQVRHLRVDDEDLARAAAGETWTAHAEDRRGNVVFQAFIPLRTDGGPGAPDALMQLVQPHGADMAALDGETVRRQVTVTVLLTLLGAGVLWLRRRLVVREREARHDELTGLLNRRALLEDGAEMVRRASVASPLALLLIDLDDFKSVNDTLGHGAGDVLLEQVATVLRERVRTDDMVVRLGGDEFAVLLSDMTSSVDAKERANELLARLRAATFVVDGVELVVDGSIGVAVAPRDGRTVEDLLQRADIAMYQVKRRRGGVAMYDNADDDHSVDRLETMTEFRRALENDELVLHYQPKVSVGTGEVSSVEALVRWQHPTRGLLGPAQFLPLVEGTALMAPLTRWVLRAAIRQAAQWHRAGAPLQVAVNIGPGTLLQRDLPARVLAALGGADLPAALLQLEITETAIMTDPRRAAIAVRQLRDRGVETVVDDFGAGYTSVAHLRTLPIAGFKLDRGLVTRMLEDPQALAVAETLIELGHRLGLQVVAEGVETELLLDRLAVLGCDVAQGYVIARPVPAVELEEWLAERTSARALSS